MASRESLPLRQIFFRKRLPIYLRDSDPLAFRQLTADLTYVGAFGFWPAAYPITLPEPEPWAVSEFFVVPSISSGEIVRGQGPIVRLGKDAFEHLDVSNDMFSIHSVASLAIRN